MYWYLRWGVCSNDLLLIITVSLPNIAPYVIHGKCHHQRESIIANIKIVWQLMESNIQTVCDYQGHKLYIHILKKDSQVNTEYHLEPERKMGRKTDSCREREMSKMCTSICWVINCVVCTDQTEIEKLVTKEHKQGQNQVFLQYPLSYLCIYLAIYLSYF